MAVSIIGNGGVVADVDENRNLYIQDEVIPGYPAAGGFYVATGGISAVVAAALSANTLLASARFSATSIRKAYVTKIRITMGAVTAGAAGGIPGQIGVQRFTAVTPSGGTARTAARLGATKGSASDMTDIRDLNAALTGSPTFGDVLGQTLIPVGSTNVTPVEWDFEPIEPIELTPGDGLALRTQVAGPATATWVYSYAMHWFER